MSTATAASASTGVQLLIDLVKDNAQSDSPRSFDVELKRWVQAIWVAKTRWAWISDGSYYAGPEVTVYQLQYPPDADLGSGVEFDVFESVWVWTTGYAEGYQHLVFATKEEMAAIVPVPPTPRELLVQHRADIGAELGRTLLRLETKGADWKYAPRAQKKIQLLLQEALRLERTSRDSNDAIVRFQLCNTFG